LECQQKFTLSSGRPGALPTSGETGAGLVASCSIEAMARDSGGCLRRLAGIEGQSKSPFGPALKPGYARQVTSRVRCTRTILKTISRASSAARVPRTKMMDAVREAYST